MSLRPRSSTMPRTPKPCRLDVALFADLFNRAASIDGTGKRKVDNQYAATRLGKSISDAWTNERFRQVMVLVR